ncbi:MAG: PQQ-binding-like beta-propeller repeat protein [Hyphomicrobiales bacterium]|nr:PQQ-binding-like beta-propeller repeat protein [Hyphomicrobiales bacterium]
MPRLLSCLTAVLLSAAASQALAQVADFRPVTEAMLENPDPADWLMLSRTFDQNRHSPLNQINKNNVGQLGMVWTRGLPAGTQEATPLVYRGVMYLNVPGGTVQAINATNGDLIWEYVRDYPKDINPRAARHKNLGIFEDMIYFGAPDGYLVALDAATGKVRWETKVDEGGITAGGILVADGKVLTNRTCMNRGREACFIAAHDARTGKEVWKFYTTAAPGEPGGESWGNMPVERRAASPWGLPGSYDPKRRTTYWGVANPDPYTRLRRHGRHDGTSFAAPADAYSNSTVAIDIATGKLRWYYQQLPGDDWDADHNQERLLLRLRLNPDPKHVKWIATDLPRNQEREVVVTVGEGGGLFVVERDTGKFLWAHPFPYDNPDLNMNDINLETGQTHVNVDKLFKKDGDKIIGCFHNTRSLWAIAYHPEKNALYVPFQDQCLSMTANEKAKLGWGPRVGVMRPGIDPNKFMNLARIDLTTGEMRILHSQPQASQGSALVTGGDLIFWGDQNRRFRAFDADSGKMLWETIVGGMVMTSTITYAVNGRQYVAITTGEGQSVSGGPLSLTRKSMAAAVRGHNSIVVFALPQK